MKPGDKVRFLRTTGEGVVKKINPDGTADVEIEDGFIVPSLRSDLVVVASEESNTFQPYQRDQNVETPVPRTPKNMQDEGMFIAFVPFNDRIASMELVNNTNGTILYSLSEKSRDGFDSLSFGMLQPFSREKCTERAIPDLNQWPEVLLQMIVAGQNNPIMLEKRMNFNPATFFRSKKQVPLMNKEGYLFKIKEEGKSVDPELLKKQFTEGTKTAEFKPVRPAREVDLHIEKLAKEHKGMANHEMLQLQMETFEKALDNAIAAGMVEITFIHGVGTGSLRDKIHKALSGNPKIEFYKDAQKERFGYGATYVKLK